MDFPNMESECRGCREAFKRIWAQHSARFSDFWGSADKWRFEDTWCDSKLDVPVKSPQSSRSSAILLCTCECLPYFVKCPLNTSNLKVVAI